jgi:hypothetical protein
MNPDQYATLLAFLELPNGAGPDDAIDAVKTLRATITALSPDNEDGEEGRAVVLAATSRLSKLTGATTLGEAVRIVETRFSALAEREKEIEAERKERKALEMAEYRKLTGELVKLGAEIPATAWQDEKGTLPVQRILDEPLSKLRARVAQMSAANRGQRLVPLQTAEDLTEAELKACEAKGIDPAKYVATRNAMKARSQRVEA